MVRNVAVALLLLGLAAPGFAAEFDANEKGQIEFNMPSGNIGCIYTPEGGTDVYEPVDGGPELSCDRVQPTYKRATLGPKGKAIRYDDVGDASCCSSAEVLEYGEVWKMDGFRCTSAATGLTCTRGAHGFSMSRKSVKVH